MRFHKPKDFHTYVVFVNDKSSIINVYSDGRYECYLGKKENNIDFIRSLFRLSLFNIFTMDSDGNNFKEFTRQNFYELITSD